MTLNQIKKKVYKMSHERLVYRLGICKQIAKLITLYDELGIEELTTRYENDVEIFYIRKRLNK